MWYVPYTFMSVKVTVGQSQWEMPQALEKTCAACKKRCKSGAKESKRGEIGEGVWVLRAGLVLSPHSI